MAGPLSSAARAKSLANDFGPTRGPNSPDFFEVALYDDNPEFDGVELTDADCPGYARFTVDNDDFTAVTEGVQIVVLAEDLPEPTGSWTKSARWAVLLNSTDDTEAWDYSEIDPMRATAAGPFEDDFELTVFYSDDSTDPA